MPGMRFEKWPTAGDGFVGVAILDRPKALNSLDLDICAALHAQLQAWEQDAGAVAVVLRGEGGRSFCAGADLRRLYAGMQDSPIGEPWANVYARQYFEVEYRLDYLLHTYAKPLLCWGEGIVMGGGVGLMMGATHRIVTPDTRYAMPEISIGLFPDVAGSWLLARLPKWLGQFMALTGAALDAADCLHWGLADHLLEGEQWPNLREVMGDLAWQGQCAHDSDLLHQALARLAQEHKHRPGPGPAQRYASRLAAACGQDTLASLAQGLLNFAQDKDPWLTDAVSRFQAGSPGSARLGLTLQRLARHLSLADVFRMEYTAALHCVARNDLREGIRALIIDKDRNPRWDPVSLEAADDKWVRDFFRDPWPADQAHPLADLGVAVR